MRSAVVLGLSIFFSAPSLAADSVWILAPVYGHDVPGAHGSIWSTELRVYNSSDQTAYLLPPCVTGGPCWMFVVPPRADVAPIDPRFIDRGRVDFAFLSVDRAMMPNLTFQLRVFDESRTELNWGTSIPVVEWDEVRGNRFWFVRIPAGAPFRHTLRLYRFLARPSNANVVVRYFDADTNAILFEHIVFLHPGDFQIDSATIPQLSSASDIRIEVSTESGEKDLWAMVSVTNDDTQVVTILPGEAYDGSP